MFLFILCFFLFVSLFFNFYNLFKRFHPDGNILITKNPNGKTTFILDLEIDPYDIHTKQVFVLKVIEKTSSEYEDVD